MRLDGIEWRPAPARGPGEETDGGDVLVLDTYSEYASAIAETTPSRHLVAFSDRGWAPESAAIVIAIGESAPDSGDGRLLAGPHFACLRRAYWEPRPAKLRRRVDNVLVATGASRFGGLADRLAKVARASLPAASVEIAPTPGARVDLPAGVRILEARDSLRDAFLRADLVVCTGGVTMLESAACGVATIVVPAVENQRRQARALAAPSAIRLVREAGVEGALRELGADPIARRRMAANAQRAVDGRGALRVASRISDLL